jgi:integrase
MHRLMGKNLMTTLSRGKPLKSALFPRNGNEWMRIPWARVREHLGMTDDLQFVPHMLRHTCATRMSGRGVSMAIIKEWLGHRGVSTTLRYTHFSPTDLRGAAVALGAAAV